MRDDNIHPGSWWYGLAASILAIGFVCWNIIFFTLFFSIKRDIKQVVVPGTHPLYFAHPGTYLIYYEYQSFIDDRIFSRDMMTSSDLNLICSIQTADDMKDIQVLAAPPSSTYNFGGKRKGVSILKFKVKRPGKYILMARYNDGKANPRIVLGIGRRLVEKIMIPGLFLMIITTITILSSAGIFWITFFRRRRAKKRLVQNSV